MALVECWECAREVSDYASTCPHCGAPIEESEDAIPRAKSRRSRTGCLVVVGLVLIVGGFFVWRSLHSDEAAPLSAGLPGAIRSPQELVDESVHLPEGWYKYYLLELYTSARVRVELYASLAHVNVMLMTPSDFEGYQQAQSTVQESDTAYTHRELLSSENVVRYDQTETLPSGEWVIVLERPLENVSSPQSTTVNLTITVY